MKKTLLLATAFVTLSANAFAAPVNNLAQGETAVGAGSDIFYVEHKLTDSFTLGLQNVDRDGADMDDIYGQFRMKGNLSGIIGNRDFGYNSKMYLGLAMSSALSNDTDGYASLIAGSNFKELQLGANIQLAHNIDLNLDYHTYMPDAGKNRNGIGVGATVKF